MEGQAPSDSTGSGIAMAGVSAMGGGVSVQVASPIVPIPAITPPAHVLVAFGVDASIPEPLAGGQGRTFKCGDVVLKPVDDPAEAAWLATTMEHLRVVDLRVARPIRASDGRWVVAGWCAQRFVSGRAEPRYGQIIETSILLHQALNEIPEPKFLRSRDDLYSHADRLAWGEIEADGSVGDGHGARLFAEYAAGRRPVDSPSQVVHGDLFGNVLFAGSAPPAVIDITPYWRPAAWAAAVVAVDALSWGGAPIDLLSEWDHLPEWSQMLRRALLFRLAISLRHPRTTPTSMVDILSAAEVIAPFLEESS